MGGITNLASNAIGLLQPISTVAGLFNDRRDDRQTARQVEQRQQLEQQIGAENAGLERERIAASTAEAERGRRAALKRAVARQRAAFGASGTGSSGGSAQAVLLGLFDESDDERAERERLDDLRQRSIDLGLTQQARTNTLQLTQLRDRQRYDNRTRIGRSLGILD